jgi:flagellin
VHLALSDPLLNMSTGLPPAHNDQMPIGLRHNSVSMTTANHLNDSAQAMSRTLKKISSGNRTERIGEDAAGTAVSVNLSAKARSGQQAVRNANDAISMLHTSEAALNESGNMLSRIRELAVQSSSETLAGDERKYVVGEYKQLAEEMKRLVASAEFNGQGVATGETYTAQVGTDGDKNHQITITCADIKALQITIGSLDMTSAEQSGRSITRIDQATDTMNEQQATIGAVHNRLLNAISNEEASTLSHTAAAGRITDADLAQETTMMAALQVKLSAGTAAMGQANGISQSILSLI